MRWEYDGYLHLASMIPIVQQVVGVATILSGSTRIVAHVAQKFFYQNTPSWRTPQELQERVSIIDKEIGEDQSTLYLGIIRFVPLVGTVVGFIMITGLDRSEGGRSIFHSDSLHEDRVAHPDNMGVVDLVSAVVPPAFFLTASVFILYKGIKIIGIGTVALVVEAFFRSR